MSDEEPPRVPDVPFDQRVGAQERRRLRALRGDHNPVWLGFATFGLIGWSVAVPALLGVALGVWLDGRHPSRYSWTLMLLIAGIGIGCLNAWHWMSREHRALRDDDEDEEKPRG